MLVGMQDSAVTLENNIAVPYNVRPTLAASSRNSTSKDLPKINENMSTQRHVLKFHSIYDSHKLKKSQLADEWVNKSRHTPTMKYYSTLK